MSLILKELSVDYDQYVNRASGAFSNYQRVLDTASKWDGQSLTFASTFRNSVFLAGPEDAFYTVPRETVALLKSFHMKESSKVLDVGCGLLRNGRLLFEYLQPGNYFGIEPNATNLRIGLEFYVGPSKASLAKPRFSMNPNFDFSVFGDQKYDFVFARSIWSHCSLAQIKTSMLSFKRFAHKSSVFLTSYCPAHEDAKYIEYSGTTWVGNSHNDTKPGSTRFFFGTLRKQAVDVGLYIREISSIEMQRRAWAGVNPRQRWLVLKLKN